MGLINLFIGFSCLVFVATTPYFSFGEAKTCSTKIQDDHHQINKAGIHMTLHKVHGPCSPLSSPSSTPLFDILNRDAKRVKVLNSRRLATTTPKTVPVNPGLSITPGLYYINVGLGTPAKQYSMIIDTGSTLTWLQCLPCQPPHCRRQVGPKFNPTASKTYKAIPCEAAECSRLKPILGLNHSCSTKNKCVYSAMYVDASNSTGYLSRDTLTVAPSETLPGFIYGCSKDNNGSFGKAAGLIGLSSSKLSMLGQLASKYGNVFSYCLPTSSSTGTLSIGTSTFNSTAYKFTPMLADPQGTGRYYVNMTGITIAGKLVTSASSSVSDSPSILDSGTTYTSLPYSVYTALSDEFAKAMSKKYESVPALFATCFKGNSSSMSVPEITLMFQGGANLKLGVQNILVQVQDDVACLAFTNYIAFNGVTVIGNVQQETFRVAYDVANSRIGFAAGGCK